MSFKVVEAFAGIGSQAKALSNLGIDHEVVNIIEWDINAIYAYDIIHNGPQNLDKYKSTPKEVLIEELSKYQLSSNGKEPLTQASLSRLPINTLKRVLEAIRRTRNLVSITDVRAKDLPDEIDLLTYSFPCQDLSISGFWHGNKGGIDRDANNRSGMLWEVERILMELGDENRQVPKYLVMENVTNILADRHIGNFVEWQTFLERIGYVNKVYNLKATNFGVPQNRTRTFMLSVYVGDDQDLRNGIETFFVENNLENVRTNLDKDILDEYLKIDYTNAIYYAEAITNTPNDTPSRRKIFNENPHLVDEDGRPNAPIVRTITTKQDRHPNSGVILHDLHIAGKSQFRYLTPRECFMLMGFDESDYQRLVDSNFKNRKDIDFLTNEKLVKFAGNSIVVNVIQAVFEQITQIREQYNI